MNTSFQRWKDLPELEHPEELQMGPRFDQPRAFLPDNGPINPATLRPPTEPSMMTTQGSNIRWSNVFNVLLIAGIVIFLLSLGY